ncbi:MAG: HAD-IA family hydrolase [Cyanobacteriota bacterium]|nr:HAD-IA family hydrolase [Cyanobacteriota bacterium]
MPPSSSSAPAAEWPRPKGLLLDAMGTLIGLQQSVGSNYAAVAEGHGISLEPGAVDAAFRQVLSQAPPLAFSNLEPDALLQAEQAWWGDRISETFASVGAPEPDIALRLALFEHFARAEPWQVYPDVLQQLQRWHAAGLKLAVVSNFDRRLHSLLEQLELDLWFDAVVVSSEAGAAKPDPRPFALALSALELEADEAWHVGDSPEDLAGARAAGLRCVLIERG